MNYIHSSELKETFILQSESYLSGLIADNTNISVITSSEQGGNGKGVSSSDVTS